MKRIKTTEQWLSNFTGLEKKFNQSRIDHGRSCVIRGIWNSDNGPKPVVVNGITIDANALAEQEAWKANRV